MSKITQVYAVGMTIEGLRFDSTLGFGCGYVGCGCPSNFALMMFCNPMLVMFLTEVRIKNESGERVTCGDVLQSGGWAVLQPRCLYTGIPAVPLFSRTEERIGPGGSLKVVYDIPIPL